MSKNIYQKKLQEVIDELETSKTEGLSDQEVSERLETYGENKLQESDSKSKWEILLDNLNNIIVYLLAVAAIISIAMGDWIEAIAVMLAVLISVLTGYFVETKAQKSVEALQNMVNTSVHVIRNGEEIEIDSSQLVPGDVMVLGEGDAIAADGRLLTSNNFAVMEASLTGESEAVDKDPDATYDEEESIGDRLNMVFSGTAVTRGKAQVIVTGTGMETEVGRISEMMTGEKDMQTPLDKEVDQLGKALIVVAFIAAALVVAIGLFNGNPPSEILHIAVILAVAAIPEAMPAVQTITLSNGMQTMAKHQALVKTLSAVETLGATSIIASDKTGTLTENQMMVESIIIKNDIQYEVSGSGYTPEGDITKDDEKVTFDIEDVDDLSDNKAVLLKLITDGYLSSDARLIERDQLDDEEAAELEDDAEEEGNQDPYTIKGDPTDGALTVLGHKVGLSPQWEKDNDYKLVQEIPFDSEKKYMAALYHFPNDTYRLIVKGAMDVVLDLVATEDGEEDFWQEKNDILTADGNRVIALASYTIKDQGEADKVADDMQAWLDNNTDKLTMDGLFGIIDPPRQDVKDAIAQTQAAGIQVKMITGDHPRTASVIARDIGIENHENTMTGKELDAIHEDKDFIDKIRDVAVFARVSPENKLQIVRAFQDEGNVVAMTGDGVNDAPALNGADIGVAMGIRGTEVAKEAADMILTDDAFGTIVDAVREGRIIFENIKKYISFLFACNMVEIVAILTTIVFMLPMPIQPLHILFLNLLVDIGPAIALAYEKAEANVMEHPPRDPESGLVNKTFLSRIIISGVIIGLGAFGVFYLFHNIFGMSLTYAQTATFTYMAIAQLFHILNVRRLSGFGLDKTFFQNKLLLAAMAFSVVLQLLVVYVPFLNNVFGTEPLTLATWGIILAIVLVVTIIVYLVKKLAGLKDPEA
ncbi:HAD-IC family P-type ATPase [Carnobacterium sp. PL24RED07]|uniref:cation-translocating P-type ATPase n=1 Tax=unclassified Carnobacterium TaxID=257487 RepID=UPI0011EC7E7E|nr:MULTISPECIES: HAD-IC family P-type ATPase [unclassified Carnobacterium]KAF3301040.1 HAD-IC family P-type ATPase [Carnobacterium sp. PL26RED25]KAF3305396.1 HAD-IC family P-type ATPase [Carnobacterium sp. PL24RED07]